MSPLNVAENEESTRLTGRPSSFPVPKHEGKTRLRFLKSTDCPTVGCYPLLALDHAMERAGLDAVTNPQGKLVQVLSKAISKSRLIRRIGKCSDRPTFVAFMGYSESKTVPFCYGNEIVPYCFDCWPSQYERWASFFKRHGVRLSFFSARQSAEYFARTITPMKSIWLAEATNPSDYCAVRSGAERDIDVLELGRKNSHYHSRIVEPLASAKAAHLYARVEGEIIFPDRECLIDGLSRSKISICFPCSQTHPARAGAVETVTHRYFESMASKCLVVGHAPQELVDLFGYNPVVEVRQGEEYEQIDEILRNIEAWDGFVERNYRRLLQVGTWDSRVESILNVVGQVFV
jgi:Glycosyl transferases group 1